MKERVVELTTLDWDRFASELWEQRVVHFRAGAAPRFSEAAVFAAACAAATAQAGRTYAQAARPPMQLTVERTQQRDVATGAPRAEDGSLAGYQARMRAELGGRRYALVVSELHSFSYPLWAEERRFLDELWRRLGLPLSGAITTLFHGNYEHTPVGVHRDRFGTILCALRGRKRMRFWRERPWRADVSTLLDYQPHLRESLAVELEPGEALYWPSSYYHVGESPSDEPASSVNIGLPISQHHTSYFVDDLTVGVIDEQDLPDELRARTRLRPVNASPLVHPRCRAGLLSPQLPAPLGRALASVRALAEPAATERHLQRTWLSRVTASGLEPVPPAAPRLRLPAGAWLRRADGAALRWIAANASPAGRGAARLLCSGNGHTVEAPSSPALEAALQRLASGARLDAAALLAALPAPRARAAVRRLLEDLVSFRALEVIA